MLVQLPGSPLISKADRIRVSSVWYLASGSSQYLRLQRKRNTHRKEFGQLNFVQLLEAKFTSEPHRQVTKALKHNIRLHSLS